MDEYTFYNNFSSDFLSGEYNQFILSGNIYDIFKIDTSFYSLSEFMVARLARSRIVIKYSLASGIEFSTKEERDDFIKLLSTNLPFFDTYDEKKSWVIKSLAHSRLSVIDALKLMKEASNLQHLKDLPLPITKPFAFIIEHAETIIPNSPVMQMGESDRQKLVFLRDWLNEKRFIESHDLIIFISQTLSEIHKSVINLPSIDRIIIDYPDFNMRKNFIAEELKRLDINSDITSDKASDLTAGLNLNGINHILVHTKYAKKPLDEKIIMSKTEEVIRGVIGDYIKIINPVHTFDDVFGFSKLKKELKKQAQIIMMNNPDITPRGYLVCGRNGVGKTFIMEAFARELGWLCIELKNLRHKYLGETDIIFERIKNVLESFKNVMVLVDEADTMFGGRGENVHETEKRLTGNFIKMIGDPKNRGKIIWVFITSRPDLLLPDFVRRLELKFGFFNPKGDDRIEFIRHILGKIDVDYESLSDDEKDIVTHCFSEFSPAQFKLITTQLIAEKFLQKSLSIHDIKTFLDRFNLDVGKEKYRVQDELARRFSTFIDLVQ